MKINRGMKITLLIIVICTALASISILSFINGKSLKNEDEVLQTVLTKDEVVAWIQAQGKEDEYYFEELLFEENNIDRDLDLEVLAKIDGGVHLGHFFVFDVQLDGSYKLIYEQPWHVELWDIEFLFDNDDISPLYNIVTRAGGSGIDVREVHLMYMSHNGEWTEAWKGMLKERTAFENKNFIKMGSYQFNDDNDDLFYWQTDMVTAIEDNKQIGELTTLFKRFEFREGQFVEKDVLD